MSAFNLLRNRKINLKLDEEYQSAVPCYAYRDHIRSGYLNVEHIENMSHSCLITLLSIHNETINIYTHLIPCILILVLSIFDNTKMNNIYIELANDLFALVCAGGFFCSVWYHMGCCRKPSHWDYYFYWDLIGIFIVISTCTLYGTYIGYYCDPLYKYIFCTIDIIFIVFCFFPMIALFPDLVSWKIKKWTMTGFVAIQLIPLFWWIYLQQLYRMDLLYSFWKIPIWFFSSYWVAFLFWHFRFPECIAPGRFDFFLHSHQIWHIFTAIPPFLWWFGMQDLLKWYNEKGC
eukprot:293631_1